MNGQVQKWIKVLAGVILSTAGLCIYSYYIFIASTEGRDSFLLARPLLNFATYPKTISEVLTSKEVKGLAPSYLKLDKEVEVINKLDKDLFMLNSNWMEKEKAWSIKLTNLKDNEIIHEWKITQDMVDLSTTDWQFSNTMPRTPILLENNNLIVTLEYTANIMRLDGESNIVWKNNEIIHHHAMNLDADSTIWSCTADLIEGKNTKVKEVKNIADNSYLFRDDYITQLDVNSGKILLKKSVSEILVENDLGGVLFGVGDPDGNPQDPMHLNDVEPVFEDGPFWKKGDLFLSIRHLSMVVLYRPSTNEVIRTIYGPFANQHDVDIIDSTKIILFNNNFIHNENDSLNHISVEPYAEFKSSNSMIYDFYEDSYSYLYKDLFEQEDVRTQTQGMQTLFSDGSIFVESQNQGKIFIFAESGVLLRTVIPTELEGYIHYPNWARVYENID